MSTTNAIQILTISTALFTSGGIASLSAFDIPLLRSQPASRSLPMIRWLFSRGSHTAPAGILLSSLGFLYLAYTAKSGTSAPATPPPPGKPGLFLAASALCFSTALFTAAAMLPTNFGLIERNEQLGGARSAHSNRFRQSADAPPRSARESVDSKLDLNQWTDGSDPQTRTERASTAEQDEEVRVLLTRFARLNYVRAVLMGCGGVVGLAAALG